MIAKHSSWHMSKYTSFGDVAVQKEHNSMYVIDLYTPSIREHWINVLIDNRERWMIMNWKEHNVSQEKDAFIHYHVKLRVPPGSSTIEKQQCRVTFVAFSQCRHPCVVSPCSKRMTPLLPALMQWNFEEPLVVSRDILSVIAAIPLNNLFAQTFQFLFTTLERGGSKT